MEEFMKKYEEWLNYKDLDKDLKEQLEEIKNDKDEIKDRFYQELKFGTAGLRGKLGAVLIE